MKKLSQKSQKLEDLEELPKFLDLESRVLTVVGNNIYIGKDKVDPILRGLLRDEAKSLQTTRLWEILNASVINEAYNLALLQSKNFEEVVSAKMLKHWSFFMLNMMTVLTKE